MYEVGPRLALQHISFRSRAQSLSDVLIFVVLRKKYDLRFGSGFLQLTSGIDAIQDWHTDVDNSDVRLRLLYRAQCLLSVGGFAHDLNPCFSRNALNPWRIKAWSSASKRRVCIILGSRLRNSLTPRQSGTSLHFSGVKTRWRARRARRARRTLR